MLREFGDPVSPLPASALAGDTPVPTMSPGRILHLGLVPSPGGSSTVAGRKGLRVRGSEAVTARARASGMCWSDQRPQCSLPPLIPGTSFAEKEVEAQGRQAGGQSGARAAGSEPRQTLLSGFPQTLDSYSVTVTFSAPGSERAPVAEASPRSARCTNKLRTLVG